MLKILKREDGVTLVALVVTVIVIIILAAVTINIFIGDNGIIIRAQEGAQNYKISEIEEQESINDLGLYINQQSGEGFTESDYIQDGLVVLYDGENNTGNGHSGVASIWKNLAQEGNDGILIDFDFNVTSGWTDNSLILDGINDWVRMTKINLNNVTIEIVLRNKSIDFDKKQIYIGNLESGGCVVQKDFGDTFQAAYYIGGTYKLINSEPLEVNKTYYLSSGYMNTEQFLKVNKDIYKTNFTGLYTHPQNNTVFALGVNPSATNAGNADYEGLANIEIFSVRIYNRYLTEEELSQNYMVDKIRFNII